MSFISPIIFLHYSSHCNKIYLCKTTIVIMARWLDWVQLTGCKCNQVFSVFFFSYVGGNSAEWAWREEDLRKERHPTRSWVISHKLDETSFAVFPKRVDKTEQFIMLASLYWTFTQNSQRTIYLDLQAFTIILSSKHALNFSNSLCVSTRVGVSLFLYLKSYNKCKRTLLNQLTVYLLHRA